MPNFSGRNTLYTLLEASQELTVLHFLLPLLAAFLLPSPCAFPNSFWPYGPTSHIHNTSGLPLFLCLHPSHLGLSVGPLEFLLYWPCFLQLLPYTLLPFSTLFDLLFLHTTLLFWAAHFPLGALRFFPTLSLLPYFIFDFCLILPPFPAIPQWWSAVPLLLLAFS